MRKYHYFAVVGALLMVVGVLLLAQPTALMAQDAPAAEPTPIVPLENPPFLAEYYFAWVASPHADATAEAFNHWNTEDDLAVPVECAKCHSTTGYIDFLGGDGSAAGAVDAPVPIGEVITCDACHNPAAVNATSVTFPSGAVVTDGEGSTRCMECHQGRASTESVDTAIADLGLSETPDTVSADLGFINIHYYAAAASLYGSEVRGGYQYAGEVYMGRNTHVDGFNQCADCHNPHTLELNIADCATCHEDVATVEDLRAIRSPASVSDFDGDGDVEEGIAGEIEGLQTLLLSQIQAYATEVAGTPIVYDQHAYPYFFIDTNANGAVDEGEAAFPNRFASWTPNLLRAAYNYQVSLKDPGGYAHNPNYHINLLFDSIMSLDGSLAQPLIVDGQIVRNDQGHFDFTAEAFRHWDEDGAVPGTCARCHTAEGLPFYLTNGVNIASAPSNSLTCTTCHVNPMQEEVYTVNEVTFPSGAVVSFGEEEPSNLCLTCHQGRESTVSVNRAINNAGVGDDEVSDALTFRNIHYFAAGASLFGTEVRGAYEFADQDYNGRFLHARRFETCQDCHQPHTFQADIAACADCHEGVTTAEDLRNIRMEAEDVAPIDYNGNGDVTEPVMAEIQSFKDALYAAIQAYATNTVGTGIVYDAHSHPYWFIDTNGNGVADEDEVNGDNRFATWTPNLLRAAYNFQFASKDPGSFAHNADYIMQVLYDSIGAVGGDVSTFTRPPVAPPAEN